MKWHMKPKEIKSRKRCLEKHNASLTDLEMLRLDCWKYLAPNLKVNRGTIDRDTECRIKNLINKAFYDKNMDMLRQIRDALKNR